jgi:hypothetical protein
VSDRLTQNDVQDATIGVAGQTIGAGLRCGIATKRSLQYGARTEARLRGRCGPKQSLRVSGNSEGIGEPTKSSVVVSAAVVVAHKQLIHEDGGKDLSLVVDESAMPRMRVQFEE